MERRKEKNFDIHFDGVIEFPFYFYYQKNPMTPKNHIKLDYFTVDNEKFSRTSGLPYKEEIVVKDANGFIYKVKIGSIEDSWENFKVLSFNKNKMKFGSPKFVPILNFFKSQALNKLKIKLPDGKLISCSPNHMFPVMLISTSSKSYKSSKRLFSIKYMKAKDLKQRDNLLVFHKIPFTSNIPKYIFIPKLINREHIWIGIERNDYLKFSYRTNQKLDDPLINLINSKFQYSKVAKIYKTLWLNLSNSERSFLKLEAKRNRVRILVKIHKNVGYWYPSVILLNDDFFRYLGWYVAEGSTEKNKVMISQSRERILIIGLKLLISLNV